MERSSKTAENAKSFLRAISGDLRHFGSKWRDYTLKSYKLILALFLCLTAASCKVIQYVPVKGDTQVEYRDSIITKLDTLTVTRTEIEKVRDYTGLLDTLTMETKGAKATAWIDTTASALKGTLEDKDTPLDVIVPHQLEYHQKDSIKIEQVPYPVEVEKIKKIYPRWMVILSILGIISTLLLGFDVYLKIKKKLPI